MAGPEDAARHWLETRIREAYESTDTGLDTDPLHLARVQAQKCLDAGPKTSDPFTVIEAMVDALPNDQRVLSLAGSWLDEYMDALKKL